MVTFLSMNAGHPLAKRLPGSAFDGGKIMLRHQKRRHADLEAESVSDHVYHTVIDAVFNAVCAKALNGWKETAYTGAMELCYKIMSSEHSSDVHKAAAGLLPLGYKAALTMLTKYGACHWTISVHYKQCNRCRFIFRCEYKDALVCICGTPKDKENTSIYIHNPFSGHVEYLWGNEITAELMTRSRERRSQDPNMIFDINDVNDPFLYDPNLPSPTFENNPLHMSVQISQDPFQPYGDDYAFSVSPATAIVNNLPPDIRQKGGFVHLFGIGPGSGKNYDNAPPMPPGVEKTDRHKWQIIVDEMLYLDAVGIEVKDAYATLNNSVDGEVGEDVTFQCRVRISNVVADFRGMEEVLGISGTPSYHGCLICWWHGFRVGGKTLYCQHRKLLPHGDKLRRILEKMYIPPPPAGVEDPADMVSRTATNVHDLPVCLRSRKELVECAEEPQRPLRLIVDEPSVVQHCKWLTRERDFMYCECSNYVHTHSSSLHWTNSSTVQLLWGFSCGTQQVIL